MDAKKEGRCVICLIRLMQRKEREMPIEEDDDDDGDFKIVASIYTKLWKSARLFFRV